MLEVWGRRSSFNVQKVMWLIGELGLAHHHIPAGGQYGLKDSPEFLIMNPHGRVPVIRDGDGTVVWESHSILRYLAARHGASGFWSDDPVQRSHTDRWMDWSQTSLQPAFLHGIFWGFYRTPEALRDVQSIEKNIRICAGYFELLDQVLSKQPFLGGERMALSDITAGTHLYRYFSLDIPRPDIPHVEAWYQRLREREAYRQHVMMPFQELFGRLDY